MPLDGVTPFPPELAERYRRLGYWQDRPLGAVFRERFRAFGRREALVAGDERVTYEELDRRSERLALHLLDLGLRPLDRVVVQLPNVAEFVYLYFALQRVGAIPLMALIAHREHEIRHYVTFVEAKGYAIPDRFRGFDFLAFARMILDGAPDLRHVLVAGDAELPGDPRFVSLRALLAREPRLAPTALEELAIDPEDPCVFLLSGGTTGIPKVIPRTHNDYVFNSRGTADACGITGDDTLLVCLPLGHNFPLGTPGMQAHFLKGGRVVLSPSTAARDALPLVERERVTQLDTVPALLLSWLNDAELRRHDLSSVRVIRVAGQKCPAEIKPRVEAAFPNAKVTEGFGMGEGLIMWTRFDDPEEVRFHTVGRPWCPDDEIRLVDDDGNEVPPGEPGELLVRGPYTLRGYYRAPEANALAFTPDGFYRSGDVMRLHPTGRYVVEGRKKDLINRGGEKISAEEVENLILALPAVRNVACVAMPDPVLGEKVCAFVVPHEGASVTLDDITAHLSARGLARFKHPQRLELVDELPLSPVGKVQKRVLSERIAKLLAAEAAPGGRRDATAGRNN
jgi:2,3-dihydroxybenzoate-AMP ligase